MPPPIWWSHFLDHLLASIHTDERWLCPQCDLELSIAGVEPPELGPDDSHAASKRKRFQQKVVRHEVEKSFHAEHGEGSASDN